MFIITLVRIVILVTFVLLIALAVAGVIFARRLYVKYGELAADVVALRLRVDHLDAHP